MSLTPLALYLIASVAFTLAPDRIAYHLEGRLIGKKSFSNSQFVSVALWIGVKFNFAKQPPPVFEKLHSPNLGEFHHNIFSRCGTGRR
jgi:hypothetical protein